MCEIDDWLIRKDWHEKDMNSPRRSRYMADVRHPLKPRKLDESPKVEFKVFRPVTKVTVRPDEAKCSKCGQMVKVTDRSHGCFSGRVW